MLVTHDNRWYTSQGADQFVVKVEDGMVVFEEFHVDDAPDGDGVETTRVSFSQEALDDLVQFLSERRWL